jgi:P-type E1-E2 ATPase
LFDLKGNQTKIIQSSRQTTSKNALVERYINRDVLFSSLILTALCFICSGLSIRWSQSYGNQWVFVPFIVDNPFQNVAGTFFINIIRFVILFQVMVPIALYVSLDIVRVLQMHTISRDKHLKYEHSISCRTFTINEDLGQIGYIFSDKTGTLTQNKLVFKAMSIGGIQYSQRYEIINEKNFDHLFLRRLFH